MGLVASIPAKIFFRDVNAANTSNIPESGPVIFVCGPHANQFLDPLLVGMTATRPVSFLIAKVSMDRGCVGFFARRANSIPVVRPQDCAKPAEGKITIKGTKVKGNGTRFKKDIEVNGSILVKGETIRVLEVKSNTVLTVREALKNGDVDEEVSYKTVPNIDYTEMYDAVTDRLVKGECVGIFPEGGSHDRTEMLPLKAGVAIMALGTMSAHSDCKVTIVPVGITYFHAHKFRSRAFLDYGNPIDIDDELVEAYAEGGESKSKAISSLMETIQNALLSVTVHAPDIERLMLMRLVRKIYRPKGVELTVAEKLELERRFMMGYERYKEEPEIIQLVEDGREYVKGLAVNGITDDQVATTELGGCRSFGLFMMRIFILLLLTIFALPGFLLHIPIGLIARCQSARKAKAALKGSNVKVKGYDVVATWKVMTAAVVVPVFYLLYTGAVIVMVCLIKPIPHLAVQIVIPIITPLVIALLGYSAIRFGETAALIFRSLRPLCLSMSPCCGNTVELKELRAKIARDLLAIVEAWGPELFSDWSADRLIGEDKFGSAIAEARERARLRTEDTSDQSGYETTDEAAPSYDTS